MESRPKRRRPVRTSAMEQFIEAQDAVVDLLELILQTAHELDDLSKRLAAASAAYVRAGLEAGKTHGDQETRLAALERLSRDGRGVTRNLEPKIPLISGMALCRAVDHFEIYLSAILALIFQTRPETLRSGSSVTVEFVLNHTSWEELVLALAERRIHELSYMGFERLSKELEEKHGITLFNDPAHLRQTVRIVEDRNLIVHNHGVIKRIYMSRVGGSSLRVGDPLELNLESVIRDITFLLLRAWEIDDRLSEKFTLGRLAEKIGNEPPPASS